VAAKSFWYPASIVGRTWKCNMHEWVHFFRQIPDEIWIAFAIVVAGVVLVMKAF